MVSSSLDRQVTAAEARLLAALTTVIKAEIKEARERLGTMTFCGAIRRLEHARDLFVLSLTCQGLRIDGTSLHRVMNSYLEAIYPWIPDAIRAAGVAAPDPDQVAFTAVTRLRRQLELPSGPTGLTLMHRMAGVGKIDRIQALLMLDVLPDLQDQEGHTPLMEAAMRGYQQVVELLLSCRGVDPARSDRRGRTAVMLAAYFNQPTVLSAFFRAVGIKLEHRDEAGDTALTLAASCRHAEVMGQLLKAGAQLNAPGQRGMTALMHLAAQGDWGLVRALMHRDGISLNDKDDRGRTAVALAAERGHLNVVECLLMDSSTDVNCRDELGRTPLMAAVIEARLSIVQRLVTEPSVHVDGADSNGSTPLVMAFDRGDPDLVSALVEGGATISQADHQWATRHIATLPYRVELARLLRNTPVIKQPSSCCAIQ
jgi:ankyrin repeat protein